MYLTKRPGLIYHQKKKVCIQSSIVKNVLKITNKSTLAKFPVKGPLMKLKSEKYCLMKEKVLRDVTNKTTSSLDRQFKKNFGTTFSNQVKKKKIMENHINKNERKSADKTKVSREIVKNTEKKFNESSVER